MPSIQSRPSSYILLWKFMLRLDNICMFKLSLLCLVTHQVNVRSLYGLGSYTYNTILYRAFEVHMTRVSVSSCVVKIARNV